MADVERLARATDGLTLVGAPAMDGNDLRVRIEIDTSGFLKGPGGLKVRPSEEIALTLTEGFPWVPPQASVDHLRWLGFPHVLQGCVLCLFLDPQREWNPHGGVTAALTRIWDWLEDAIAGRFDPAAALHHGFGGVPTISAGGPLLVVRNTPADLRAGIRAVAVKEKAPQRFDLVSWSTPTDPVDLPALAFVSAQPLRLGLPRTMDQIAHAIAQPVYAGWDLALPRMGFPTVDMIQVRLERLIRDAPPEQRLVLVFAAPNTAVTGPGRYDLMAAETTAAHITKVVSALMKQTDQDLPPLDFFHVDDVRPEIVTRRDDKRPTNWFDGRSVELWGCGALGSWIAELLVRAGVQHLRLRDPGRVTQGLLVRQNYCDADIGRTKADALAERLRAVNPDADISALGSALAVGHDGLDAECDLLVDATVNAQISTLLDAVAVNAEPQVLVSQVATDSNSATLGIVTISSNGFVPSELDAVVRDSVLAHPKLEAFRSFWDPDDDFLTPARGCSTPTFRGSAADVMGIASSIVSLLGGLAQSGQVGAQLIALPHSPSDAPPRTWVPALTTSTGP